MNTDARKVIARLLDTDPRRRMTAEELVENSYVKCEDIRLTVFEQAGTIMRKALQQAEYGGNVVGNRRFKTQTSFSSTFSAASSGNVSAKQFHRDAVKEAHIAAVENLVRHLLLFCKFEFYVFLAQKLLGYETKDIEAVFKEESNKRRSDVYETYQNFVNKHLIMGKDKMSRFTD